MSRPQYLQFVQKWGASRAEDGRFFSDGRTYTHNLISKPHFRVLRHWSLRDQHFKAFLVSKFNSETSFLYQLFKEKLNFIVTEPCKVICKSIFMIFIIIYIYSYLYLFIYTPSYPHFKAFPVSKFNSETSFLYQLFKKNLNFIVFKTSKLINEVLLLLVTTFQDYYYFKPYLNI